VDFCAHNTPLVNIASHLSRIAKAKIQVPSSNIENRVSRKLEGAPLSEVLQSLGLTPKEPEPLDPRLVQWLKDLLQHVDPPQWTVSRNGQFKGVATEGECRVRSEGTFWARFEFAIDGSSHTIEGERPFDGAPSLVTFDGASCPGGLLGLATKVGGFPPNARLEVTFELPPSSGRYRFDAEPNLVIE
jgi:hypothetical protein